MKSLRFWVCLAVTSLTAAAVLSVCPVRGEGEIYRDVLRLRHSVVTAAADAAAGKGERGHGRQLRSELMMLSALPVAELRGQADALAREIRDVDVRIQRANWEVDLLD